MLNLLRTMCRRLTLGWKGLTGTLSARDCLPLMIERNISTLEIKVGQRYASFSTMHKLNYGKEVRQRMPNGVMITTLSGHIRNYQRSG